MKTTLFFLLIQCVVGDIYMHMPRGSNNRLDEANRDRAKANRLFDSQNNNRGGSNVGSTYYTRDSRVYMEWTNQHSCGAASNDCEIVVQYMCDDNLRDGTTTERIPTNPNQCYEYDCDNDLEYGRQESLRSYLECQARVRNEGLFTGAQNLQGDDATYTRQNPNGDRYGYECAEERDYYPYWHPTAWKDIRIMTNDPQRCADYQAKSQNVASRYHCQVPEPLWQWNMVERDGELVTNPKKSWIPINQTECEVDCVANPDSDLCYGNISSSWVETPSWGIPAPVCQQNWWSRDNHLGNVPQKNGQTSTFNWDFDQAEHEQCVFRMRYNITTGDYTAFESDTSTEVGVDSASNAAGTDPDRDPAEIALWEDYGLERADVEACFDPDVNNNDETNTECRGYIFRDDPYVDLFGSLLTQTPGEARIQMNINTNQFGRTFQDRSHRYAMRAKATGACADTVVHNIQIRGKRGNIVQTYPGTEYDFAPSKLAVQVDECVHFQWTGSNTNPNNNAGQGRQGTDRANVVAMGHSVYNEGHILDDNGPDSNGFMNEVLGDTLGQFGRSFPNNIQTSSFLGFDDATEEKLALGGAFGGELSQLDDASTYFDAGVKKVTQAGIYHYLSTRANNFSNRSHKAKITVSSVATTTVTVGYAPTTIQTGGVTITISEGAFTSATDITVVTQPATTTDFEKDVKSDYVEIWLSQDGEFEMALEYSTSNFVHHHRVMHNVDHSVRDMDHEDWEKIDDVEFKSGVATFSANTGGVYVVEVGGLNAGWVTAITLLVLLGTAGIAWMLIQFNVCTACGVAKGQGLPC